MYANVGVVLCNALVADQALGKRVLNPESIDVIIAIKLLCDYTLAHNVFQSKKRCQALELPNI